MVKHKQNSGFTILELLFVLSILAILLLLCVPICTQWRKPIDFVINDIAFLQYQAIIENEKTRYEEYDCDITFNRKGNVNHADTYHIDGIDIIISLATGRVYVDQDEQRDGDD